jgi:hypothetical protein
VAGDTAAGPSWEDQKRERNRLAKLPARRDRVLAQIEAAEARKQAITDLYCGPGFFERTSAAELAALEEEQAALAPRIEALMTEWEQLEQELAALQAG